MQLDDETWAAVRSAYEDPAVSLAEIAARFGLTPQRIGVKAKKEGWKARERPPKPRVTAKRPSSSKRPAPANDRLSAKTSASQTSLPTRGAQKQLVGRLYRAISLKLEHMEKRMASGEARSAQDEERESRALATLINNFEKVTEAVTELDRDRDIARSSGAPGSDAERMRREIAERLERLGGIGTAEPGSGKPRP
jgi:hypothetical protein